MKHTNKQCGTQTNNQTMKSTMKQTNKQLINQLRIPGNSEFHLERVGKHLIGTYENIGGFGCHPEPPIFSSGTPYIFIENPLGSNKQTISFEKELEKSRKSRISLRMTGQTLDGEPRNFE